MPADNFKNKIPSVNSVLEQSSIQELLTTLDHAFVTEQVRRVTAEFRESLKKDDIEQGLSPAQAAGKTAARIQKLLSQGMCRVVNATGTIVHTGLGRAVLPERVRNALSETLKGYCFLQTEQEDLERAVRERFIINLFREITGAETAVAVNNNAAALFLVMHHVARGQEVIISRGELVEIGGSFRIPEVMKQGGAELVEVGTTNRTHINDYQDAVTERTAAIMKVHQSNFRIEGFTASPSVEDLARLAHDNDLCMIHDLGGGAMVDFASLPFSDEPCIKHSLDAGVDILCFSTDKVLGGPQGGVILGRKKYIEPMRKDPFFRILRPGKITLIALEAAVRIYTGTQERILKEIPVLEMYTRDLSVIQASCTQIADFINGLDGFTASTVDEVSASGGGALPGVRIPTKAVSVIHNSIKPEKLSYLLRTVPELPVLARIKEERIIIDPRTLLEGETELVKQAFQEVVESQSRKS